MKEKLKDSLNKRKELEHEYNDTQYQEEEFEELSKGSVSNESILDMMENNETLN